MGVLIDIKVQLITKGYSHIHGVDYLYTFSCTHNKNHLLKVLKLLVAKKDKCVMSTKLVITFCNMIIYKKLLIWTSFKGYQTKD
jgi:hypothetical protein